MLYTNGFGYIWENQYVEHENEFLASFTQRLKDQFLQEWSENILLSWFCTSNINLAFAMNTILILLLYENLGMIWQFLDLGHLD